MERCLCLTRLMSIDSTQGKSMDISLLKQAEVFADLDDEELAAVAEICAEQTFQSAKTIFKEGEPGNRLFIIAEGEVRISRNVPGSGEEALTVLKVGACFGEMSLFDRSERSTDAIANKVWFQFSLGFELTLRSNMNWLVEYRAQDGFGRHRVFLGLTTQRGGGDE